VHGLGYEIRLEMGYSLGNLSFYQLFAKDFKGAEQSAREALNPTSFEKPENYDAEMEWVHTNLALALLYQGKFEEAKAIYLKYKDIAYGETTYKEAFLSDFKELEAEGITHPDVAKIKQLLQDD
jgi:tetratricopeptide (TPR) repeat protein